MAKAKKAAVRWKFGDTYTDQPLEQLEEQLLRQALKKAQSDDPELRLSGEDELKQRAARLANEIVTKAATADRTHRARNLKTSYGALVRREVEAAAKAAWAEAPTLSVRAVATAVRQQRQEQGRIPVGESTIRRLIASLKPA